MKHEDKQAHTARLTSAAGAGSRSGDDDGDGWLDQLADDTTFLADTVNVTSASAGNNSGSGSDSEGDAWANTTMNYVDGCDSDSGLDSESNESNSAMSCVSDCEPAYSPPRPAAQHLHAGGNPDCTAFEGNEEPYTPTRDNPACDVFSASMLASDKPELEHVTPQVQATLDEAAEEPELEHVTSQVQVALDEASFDDFLMAMAAARRAADPHDEIHTSRAWRPGQRY